MISLVCILLLCLVSCTQATSIDSLKPEQHLAVGAMQAKESAQVVTKDTSAPANQIYKSSAPKRKVLNPEEREKPFLNVFFERKTLSTMEFDQLKERKDECLKNNDKETAIKYLERMIHLKTDLNELKSLMLEMAQLLYDKKDYAKSSQMFTEFALLYPGSDEVEMAMYQAIISNSNLMLDAERDQSKTIETLELAQKFLERPSFNQYKKEVEVIERQCEERLLESNINIFNFYLSRGNFVAANARLDCIKNEFASKHIPDITTRLASLDKCYADATVNLKGLPGSINADGLSLAVAAQEQKDGMQKQPCDATV